MCLYLRNSPIQTKARATKLRDLGLIRFENGSPSFRFHLNSTRTENRESVGAGTAFTEIAKEDDYNQPRFVGETDHDYDSQY